MALADVTIKVTTRVAETQHKIAASHEIRSEFDRLFKCRTFIDRRTVNKLLGDYAERVGRHLDCVGDHCKASPETLENAH